MTTNTYILRYIYMNNNTFNSYTQILKLPQKNSKVEDILELIKDEDSINHSNDLNHNLVNQI